jgi:hypothetical protein
MQDRPLLMVQNKNAGDVVKGEVLIFFIFGGGGDRGKMTLLT